MRRWGRRLGDNSGRRLGHGPGLRVVGSLAYLRFMPCTGRSRNGSGLVRDDLFLLDRNRYEVEGHHFLRVGRLPDMGDRVDGGVETV